MTENEKKVQEVIIEKEGYLLSDGTLRVDHLLGSVYDFLEHYNLNPQLREEILKVFTFEWEGERFKFDNSYTLWNYIFYGEATIKDEQLDDANYLLNEDVMQYMMTLAPQGYYYGSSYGDGALIGYFLDEEEYY